MGNGPGKRSAHLPRVWSADQGASTRVVALRAKPRHSPDNVGTLQLTTRSLR